MYQSISRQALCNVSGSKTIEQSNNKKTYFWKAQLAAQTNKEFLSDTEKFIVFFFEIIVGNIP
jgi:hypothetical protein